MRFLYEPSYKRCLNVTDTIVNAFCTKVVELKKIYNKKIFARIFVRQGTLQSRLQWFFDECDINKKNQYCVGIIR